MPRALPFLVAVTAAVLLADQATKFLALERLTTALDGQAGKVGVFLGAAPPVAGDGYHFEARPAVVLSQDFFRLRYAENPGAAFGLFRNVPDPYRGPLFHLISLGAVLLISYSWTQLTGARAERFAKWGLPLVLGGALGNYVDRLARGFVIDFLEAHWREAAYWPAFNVADSAIVVGVGLLLVDSLVRREPSPAARVAS